MVAIEVNTATANYPVLVGKNCLKTEEATIKAQLSGYSKVLFITDENVAAHYTNVMVTLTEGLAQTVPVYITPAGEAAKTFSVYEKVMTHLIQHGLDRKSVIVAFGGGAVGDLAGFVAASFMRGIDFIQMPTTILAHDSAVGGKTAINHPLGKNLVGAFHQPVAVYYDTALLETLPERQMRSGFAELIKHGLIADNVLLEKVMTQYPTMASLYKNDMTTYLEEGIQIKANIVAVDEKEQGIRAYLNFGHTFGHAIEAAGNFSRWFHGEAIMVGMKFALLLSEEVTGLQFERERWEAWSKTLGYDLSVPDDLAFEELFTSMLHDKKTTYQAIHFVLLNKIGEPSIHIVEKEILQRVFEKMK